MSNNVYSVFCDVNCRYYIFTAVDCPRYLSLHSITRRFDLNHQIPYILELITSHYVIIKTL